MPDAVVGLRIVPVVVSDGSTDRTAAVAREAGAFVTELPINRGGGLALRVGYEIALDENPAPAELVHAGEGIPLLEKKFVTNLGRRFSAYQAELILQASLERSILEAMPVNEYVDLYHA